MTEPDDEQATVSLETARRREVLVLYERGFQLFDAASELYDEAEQQFKDDQHQRAGLNFSRAAGYFGSATALFGAAEGRAEGADATDTKRPVGDARRRAKFYQQAAVTYIGAAQHALAGNLSSAADIQTRAMNTARSGDDVDLLTLEELEEIAGVSVPAQGAVETARPDGVEE